MATPAKNRVATLPEFLEGASQAYNDPAELDDDPAAVSAEFALTSTLQQLGEDEAATARVIVHRMVEDKGRQIEEWLKETTPAEFAVDGVGGIAREFGGGMYRVRVFVRGQKGFLTQKVIRIAQQKENPAVQTGADISQLAGAMMQGFQQLGALITQAVSQNKPAPVESRADMLREMALMRDLFAPAGGGNQASPAVGMGEMMEIFKQGMEIGRIGGGEPSTADVLMKGLEAFAPALSAVVTQAGQAALAPPVQRPMQPHPAAPQLAAPAPQPTGESDVNIVKQQMLKQYLNFLATQARNGSDPYTYANLILDNLSEEEVQELLTRPDWLDYLGNICPAVKSPDVAPWFGELKNAIAELLAPESDGLTGPVETGNTSAHATLIPDTPTQVNLNPGADS